MVGHADFVWLARAMLDNPRWPWHAANALGAKLDMPVTTAYAVRRAGGGTLRRGCRIPCSRRPRQRQRRAVIGRGSLDEDG